MFIWDFVANPIMDALMDWFYSQVVGFLGAFFAQMGNMGAELFELEWVQAVVLFFSSRSRLEASICFQSLEDTPMASPSG